MSTRIAILIFDELTALDAIGPYEVLSRIPGVELRFVAREPGVKRTDTGALGMEADLALGDLPDPDVLLEPTEIYVRPILELLASPVAVRGLAHITGEGFDNLLRLEAEVGYEIDDPLPVPPVFGLIQELGEVSDAEMREGFNLGCGFCCVVAADDEGATLELLQRHYPAAPRIGRATDRPGEVSV